MEITAELKHLFKALRLSPLLSTLPERAAYAKGNKLTHLEFLELLLSDEVERRTQEQAHDFYEIVSERYGRGSTILTSNRHITEWVTLFDDQILANSALDRLAHNAHQMIIEGESCRKKKGFHQELLMIG